MLDGVQSRVTSPIRIPGNSYKSCAASGVPQSAIPQTSRAGGMLRVRFESMAGRFSAIR
jgi:hypothetical protein